MPLYDIKPCINLRFIFREMPIVIKT
jgi:hypothetical protein